MNSIRPALLSLIITSTFALAQEPKVDPIADSVKEARELYHKGEYAECISFIERGEIDLEEDRRYTALKARTRLAMGEYDVATETVEDDWVFERSQEGQMLLYDIRRAEGDFEKASEHALEVFNARRYAGATDLLAIGRAELIK